MKKNTLTFDKHLDIKFVNSKKGYCRIKLNLKPNHLNHGGIAHGGVLASLCDIALAGAVGTLLSKNEWCVTAQLDIHYLNPAFPGTIFGYGMVVRKGSTLAFVSGGVETKDKKQIANAHGIWVIKTFPSRRIKKAKTLD